VAGNAFEVKSYMSAVQTFGLNLPAWSANATRQSKTQQTCERVARHPGRAISVTNRKVTLRAGEEWEVVQRALRGDPDALNALFAPNSVRMYRTAFSLLRNKEDAEDALQDGLLSAYTKLRSFEGRSRFSTWLTRIVLNAALMNRRRACAHRQLSLDQIVGNGVPPWAAMADLESPDPEQNFARVENHEVLKEGMSRLPFILRSTLYLQAIQDLSTREAAAVEGVNIGVIKSRSFRARRKLVGLLDARELNL
jgi:RNA polymerase sigma-70 factor (ECF subfamily)